MLATSRHLRAPLLIVSCLLVQRSAARDTNEGADSWNAAAREELTAALRVRWNEGQARNVVLFVGDGMGPSTVTAARIYRAKEEGRLAFEHFPHVGLLKTYNADRQVPDSASTATALFSGVKGNYKTGGVDQSVQMDDCEASLRPEARLKNMLHWAIEAGKDTGFVTTTRVTHATPSALYAHHANRNWECEQRMPASASRCKDIARQLVEDEPGRSIKVIMGGGRQCLNTNLTLGPSDPLDTWSCRRQDGRELVSAWRQDKEARGLRHAVLANTRDLRQMDVDDTDYVLGIFANGHLMYDFERDKSPDGMPSLKEMTSVAIKVLSKNEKGFFLMVEGGMIDMAHHRGYASRALNETAAMSDAVQEVLDWVRLMDRTDTLVIVTSDHAHALSINGYPARGNDILGVGGRSKADGVPFTTLTYATGDLHAYNYSVGPNGTVVRPDPSTVDTTSFHYHQQAAITSDEAHHAGVDVAVYATGPMAHLFHSLHEQNYVAHVMAYAARLGPYAPSSGARGLPQAGTVLVATVVCALVTFRL
ncbi:alkaline phosphatase-like [Bacillus rossius redtenbacheri]|uniref:alkaline phosphatase-like n=1 Tax=Bacillus rossius redtenbacheri TaxID=93214 RepID=UPI002FDED7B2